MSPWTLSSVSNTGELTGKEKTNIYLLLLLVLITTSNIHFIMSNLTLNNGNIDSRVMNKPGCLSILACQAPRRAVALWSPVLYFFPVPEPVSCGGAVSNDDPLLPASRMDKGLPRALEPLNNLGTPTLSVSFQVNPHRAFFPFFLIPPFNCY